MAVLIQLIKHKIPARHFDVYQIKMAITEQNPWQASHLLFNLRGLFDIGGSETALTGLRIMVYIYVFAI